MISATGPWLLHSNAKVCVWPGLSLRVLSLPFPDTYVVLSHSDRWAPQPSLSCSGSASPRTLHWKEGFSQQLHGVCTPWLPGKHYPRHGNSHFISYCQCAV